MKKKYNLLLSSRDSVILELALIDFIIATRQRAERLPAVDHTQQLEDADHMEVLLHYLKTTEEYVDDESD